MAKFQNSSNGDIAHVHAHVRLPSAATMANVREAAKSHPNEDARELAGMLVQVVTDFEELQRQLGVAFDALADPGNVVESATVVVERRF